jgi:hypothetical protein
MHELMHRLGFEHEHSRPDRNQFIEVFKDNINGNSHNFEPKYGIKIWSCFVQNKARLSPNLAGIPRKILFVRIG